MEIPKPVTYGLYDCACTAEGLPLSVCIPPSRTSLVTKENILKLILCNPLDWAFILASFVLNAFYGLSSVSQIH